MALTVIGAGWGHTGTESLKKALELIGYGKCYHMFELIKDGKKVVYWEQLFRGKQPDYEDLFEGFQSTSDFPACMYYKEFMVQYPEAKVILTWRDFNKWYESASKTILKRPPAAIFYISRLLGLFSSNISYFPRIYKMAEDVFFNGLMKGKKDDRDFVKPIYNSWVEEVKKHVPADRLLVYEVKDGWEPLCKFLNVPLPSVPFPKANDRDEFQKRLKVRNFLKEFGTGK